MTTTQSNIKLCVNCINFMNFQSGASCARPSEHKSQFDGRVILNRYDPAREREFSIFDSITYDKCGPEGKYYLEKPNET